MKTKVTSKRPKTTRSLQPKTRSRLSAPSKSSDIKTIMVPMDFSEYAENALREAAAMAKVTGAKLEIIHVFEPDYCPPTDALFLMNYPADRHGVEARLRQLCRKYGQSAAHVQVTQGPVIEKILAAARQSKTDLIVMPAHSYTQCPLGSTTEKVARHAPCPVLIVRDNQTKSVTAARSLSASAH